MDPQQPPPPPAQHPPPPAQPPHAQPVTSPPQQNQLALWSLILGLLGFFMFGLLTGIPAIICGHKSRKAIKVSNGQLEGAGMTTAGLILGYFATIVYTLIVIGSIALFGLFSQNLKTELEDATFEMQQMEFEELNDPETIEDMFQQINEAAPAVEAVEEEAR